MCDYSLRALATRPAEVGETLITTTFRGTSTRGFASEGDPATAVCMLPGTELAFAADVEYEFASSYLPRRKARERVARFRQIDVDDPEAHHDALEFPDGRIALVARLIPGQVVSVLQLPVGAAARRTTRSRPPARSREGAPVPA